MAHVYLPVQSGPLVPIHIQAAWRAFVEDFKLALSPRRHAWTLATEAYEHAAAVRLRALRTYEASRVVSAALRAHVGVGGPDPHDQVTDAVNRTVSAIEALDTAEIRFLETARCLFGTAAPDATAAAHKLRVAHELRTATLTVDASLLADEGEAVARHEIGELRPPLTAVA